MKTKSSSRLLADLAGSAICVKAQNEDNQPPGPPPRGPEGRHHRPPPPPIVLALDTNHDGVIDAQEIANASAALLTLDKNGDGQLTPE